MVWAESLSLLLDCAGPEYGDAKSRVEQLFQESGQLGDAMGRQLVLRNACNETLWHQVKFTNVTTNVYETGKVYTVLKKEGLLEGSWLNASTWQSEVVPTVDKAISNKRSSTNSMMKQAFMGELLTLLALHLLLYEKVVQPSN